MSRREARRLGTKRSLTPLIFNNRSPSHVKAVPLGYCSCSSTDHAETLATLWRSEESSPPVSLPWSMRLFPWIFCKCLRYFVDGRIGLDLPSLGLKKRPLRIEKRLFFCIEDSDPGGLSEDRCRI